MQLIPLNTKNVKAIWGRVGTFLRLINLSQSAYNARVDSGRWFISSDGALVEVHNSVPRCDGLALKELTALAERLEEIRPDWHCWPFGFLNKTSGVCRASIILGLTRDDPLFAEGLAGDCAKRVRAYISKLSGV
jgi:hypothetical protein